MKRVFITSIVALLFLFSCTNRQTKSTKKTVDKNIENVSSKKQDSLFLADLDTRLLANPNDVNLLVKRSNRLLKVFLKTTDEEYLYKSKEDAAKAFRLDSNNYEARMAYTEALSRTPILNAQEIQNVYRHYTWLLNKKKTPKAYVGLASYYTHTQNPEKGIEFADKALRLDVKYRDAYAIKSTLFLQMQKPSLAISSLETAVQQDNEFIIGYMQLANLYTIQKKYPIALERFKNVLVLNKNSTEALYGIAMSNQMLNNFKEAKTTYRTLLEKDPKHFLAYYNLGYIHQYHDQDIDSAMIYYTKSIDLFPENVKLIAPPLLKLHLTKANYHLGQCCEQKKDISRALLSYGKSLKYDPDFELSKSRVKELKKDVYKK